MADQTQRLEIATVRAEVGSNILYRFSNDAAAAPAIPTESGDIQNLKQVVLDIQSEAAEKISIATTIYPTVSAGLAATPNQSIFLVQSGEEDEIYTVWKNEAGTAVNTGKTALSATAIQTALDASNEAAQAAEDAADIAITRTARYLAPSDTQPVKRDDGLPLQVGDVWFDTIDQTEYRYTDDGWRPNDSLVAVRELEDSLLSAQGSSKIGSKIDAEGSVYRLQASINADRITADDFGLIGDGSDETIKIVAFFAAKAGAGKSYLQRDKVYGFSGQLVFPSGLDLVTNGSTFRRLATAGDYGVRVLDNVNIDVLRISTPGGATEGGTEVVGSGISIGRYKFTSDTPDCGYAAPRQALYVHDGSDITIRRTYISNHSKAMRYQRTVDTYHGFTRANAVTIGLYCIDTNSAIFKGGRFFDPSPSATGGNGQNTVLIEATTDLGVQDVRIIDWNSEWAAEHGFRIGGNHQVDNVHFVRCVSRKAGSGSAPTGGSGFKVLGANSRGVYHTNIYLTDCVSEDAGQVPGENFNALDISWVDGFHVEGFISRKRTRPYASTGGIRLSRLRNGTIDSPIVRDPLTGALIFLEVDGDTGVAMDSVTVSGGLLHRSAFDVITMNCKSSIYKNVLVDGALVLGGRSAVRAESALSGGSYTQVQMRLKYSDPTDTSAGPAITGSSDILYDFTGPWYGSYAASGRDGSTYTDTTSGLIRVRRGGIWIGPIDTVGGVWSPGLTNISNADSVSGNTCQYMRVGSVVTFSGVLQIKPSAVGVVAVDISIPVAATFTGFSQAAGTARSSGGEISGSLSANTATGAISLTLSATSTTNRNVAFHGTYRIP